MNIILYYSAFLQLGVFDGLTREIPYAKGKGEVNKVLSYREIGFTFSLITASVGMTALLAASIFLKDQFDPVVNTGIQVMAIIIFFYHLYGFYDYYLRAEQNFVFISRTKMMYALGMAIFQVLGAAICGIQGLLVGVLLANILIVSLLFLQKPIALKWPSFSIVGGLMRTGIPMLLNGIATSVLATFDRLIILTFLGRKELGYYAIAHLAANLIDFIPATIYNVFLPRIMEKIGQTKDPHSLNKYWLEPLFILSLVLPLCAGFGWLIAPLGLMILLPQYMPGLLALKILVLSVFFGAVPILSRNLFVALDKQHRIHGVYTLTIAMSAVLNYLFIKMGLGIAGVALATSISFFTLGLVTLYMALGLLGRIKDFAVIALRIYSPSFVILGLLVAIDMMVSSSSVTIQEELLLMAKKTGVFIILVVPAACIIERRTKMFSWVLHESRVKHI